MGKLHFLELNAAEVAELNRPARGVGGFQSFIERPQSQVNHATATIKVTNDDVAEIQHYAFDFKQGGFQERLLFIFGRVLGAKLGREE